MDLELSPPGADDPGGPTTVRVTGFIDLSTSSELVDAGLQLLWSDSCLALDLSDVTFMDASGVAALSALGSAAQRLGMTFEITAASFSVRRILRILDLSDQWSAPPPDRTRTG